MKVILKFKKNLLKKHYKIQFKFKEPKKKKMQAC